MKEGTSSLRTRFFTRRLVSDGFTMAGCMIRRASGKDWLLITQHDHAVLAGELASHVGNEHFAPANPYEQTVTGVRLHDCGWPTHDDAPTINERGDPLDVFEAPRDIAIKAWTTSAERAAEKDPYAGILTSLHVLALSVMAIDSDSAHPSWSFEDPVARATVVKFQHRQIEFQERLRQRLGLRTETPTATKQPKESLQRAEDQLKSNVRLLQVMDLLSLGLCCTAPPVEQTPELFRQPGGDGERITMRRAGDELHISAWPFDVSEIQLQIPVCKVPNRTYANDADLRSAYANGSAEIITAHVRPA